jgi:phosphatidylglycerophosphatase A
MTPPEITPHIKPSMFFASFFGAGFFPVAPGTAGSLAAAGVYAAMVPRAFGLFAAAAMFIAGIFIVGATRNYLETEDDQRIVIDEAAGVWLAMAIAPAGLWYALSAVALFRFFDVLKPLGIKKIQRLPYAWGIMLDDTAAGICAGAVLRAFEFLAGMF